MQKSSPMRRPPALRTAWPAVVLLLAVTVAYCNSLEVPFLFDDIFAIEQNASLHHFGTALARRSSGTGITVDGRPVLNLSFAVNHAWGGLEVRGYHATNLLIHAGAGLLLLGIVRRTVRRLAPGDPALPIALIAALLWTLHPLQTESVTYVVQRAESLAGFFYLLTLYAFIRSLETPAPTRWRVLSVAACLLGMGTKEVVASAPLMVLWYDRIFHTGTLAGSWRSKRGYYLSLASTWLLLLGLLIESKGRGSSAGMDSSVTVWLYALKQCQAIVHYLRLSFWPHPLTFDYGTETVASFSEVWPQATLLLFLVAATGVALWRRPALGFLGAWFFVQLAPSSSVVPIATQTMAEHRMYLALAAVAVLVALGLHRLAGRHGLLLGFALAAGAICLTLNRNTDYGTAVHLWRDTVTKAPHNPRAHAHLGEQLARAGNLEDAVIEYQTACRLKPDHADAYCNLGSILIRLRRPAEAIPAYEAALRLQPEKVVALTGFGLALMVTGRLQQAEAQFLKAIQLEPDNFDARNNLADVLILQNRHAEAHAIYELVLQMQPANTRARERISQLEAVRNSGAPRP